MQHRIFFGLILLPISITILSTAVSSSAATEHTRYLLYSVNPGEGFNLCRDVFMRAANLVKKLREREDWVLVLPPWSQLYHWKSPFKQTNVPWRQFFDMESLREYVPVMEFEDYIQREGLVIEEVLQLQLMREGIGGSFVEKIEERSCNARPLFQEVSDGRWSGRVFSREDIVVKSFRCVSVIGFASILIPELQERRKHVKSVLVERLETVMHIKFGGVEYWAARRSMVYAAHLREAGNKFMRRELGYDPGSGNGRQSPREGGGPFISVHLRRGDYLHARPSAVPSLERAAQQINTFKREQNLGRVFLASDASKTEKRTLSKLVEGLVWYEPSEDELRRYGDGGVSIIDQWIASHAKYFAGSTESTFSFRIRDDRQFMGFSKESTFNNLCGPDSCKEPTFWKVPEHSHHEL